MNNPKIGFVGAGNISGDHFISAKKAGFDLYGICAKNNSVRAKNAKTTYGFKKYFVDINSLLNSEIEALVILVPPQEVKKIVYVLQNFKGPILIEKPGAISSSDLREIKSKLKRNKKVMLGYNRRFYDSVIQLKEELKFKKNLQFHVNISEASWSKNIFEKEIQNLVITNSIHIFDLIYYLFGKVKVVSSNPSRRGKYIRSNTLILKSDKGYTGSINLNFGVPNTVSIECFSLGMNAKLSPLENLEVYKGISQKTRNGRQSYKRYKPIIGKKITQAHTNYKAGFPEMYESFMQIMLNKPVKRAATLDDGLLSLKLAESVLGIN